MNEEGKLTPRELKGAIFMALRIDIVADIGQLAIRVLGRIVWPALTRMWNPLPPGSEATSTLG
jgi:hypothetical protein